MPDKDNSLNRIKVGLLATLCCALWGSAFPVVKLGYTLTGIDAFDSASQMVFAGERFLLAGLICLFFMWRPSVRAMYPTKSALKPILIIGFFQTFLQYAFFYTGIAHTSGVKTSILTGMNVFMAMLVAHFIFKYESISQRKYIGTFIGFIGIVIMNFDFSVMGWSFKWYGEGMIVLTTISYAFSVGFMKYYSRWHSPVLLATYQFLIGGLGLSLLGGALGGDLVTLNLSAWMVIFYLGAASAAAYMIWSYLLKHYPVSEVAIYGFTSPIFGVVFSALLIGEFQNIVSLRILFALLCVTGGIFLVNRTPKP